MIAPLVGPLPLPEVGEKTADELPETIKCVSGSTTSYLGTIGLNSVAVGLVNPLIYGPLAMPWDAARASLTM